MLKYQDPLDQLYFPCLYHRSDLYRNWCGRDFVKALYFIWHLFLSSPRFITNSVYLSKSMACLSSKNCVLKKKVQSCSDMNQVVPRNYFLTIESYASFKQDFFSSTVAHNAFNVLLILSAPFLEGQNIQIGLHFLYFINWKALVKTSCACVLWRRLFGFKVLHQISLWYIRILNMEEVKNAYLLPYFTLKVSTWYSICKLCFDRR